MSIDELEGEVDIWEHKLNSLIRMPFLQYIGYPTTTMHIALEFIFPEHIIKTDYGVSQSYKIVLRYDGQLIYYETKGRCSKKVSFEDLFTTLKPETKEIVIYYLDVFV